MYVRHLTVADFRSWTTADLELEPGPTVLLGANGQGKTNLVEALGYVATLGSHRVSTDAPLVRAGADRALIRTAVAASGREMRVELEITPGRANRARLNGAVLSRPRDVLGVLQTVLFAPEDLAIVRGDPSERRRFLDEVVVARSPRMASVRADYERVLKQRAALLKSAGSARRSGSASDLGTLDVWDGHLAAHGAVLLQARLHALDALGPLASSAYAEVAPASPALRLHYTTSLTEQLPELVASHPRSAEDVPAVPVIEKALLEAMTRTRSAELERGVNLVGPHRDDLYLGLGELPVRGYASHGEVWSVALALRLGNFELLRTEASSAGDPVLILDDVFAELDRDRRDQLAVVAGKAEQVLVTAAVVGDVPEALAGTRYTVCGGSVHRE